MKSTDTSVKEREINLEDAGGGNKKNKQWLRFGATSLLIAIGITIIFRLGSNCYRVFFCAFFIK
ncbi:hypothetical protein H7R52_16805 [Weissella confusa]|uniref:Uncharacterized protein n=1 Tax=Weissella confusa TaxID=1583 RepID=A0A923NH98_WEICO|nr:hypothetical protein [Weissella confusa]